MKAQTLPVLSVLILILLEVRPSANHYESSNASSAQRLNPYSSGSETVGAKSGSVAPVLFRLNPYSSGSETVG